eukprot:c20537_g1_i1.p1 GENE.c20537_g1_i1~~c20537_g1_i1.p1  ORF type:complete len:399 (+),score=98.45 c20537_g1_i1:51-1199(+)
MSCPFGHSADEAPGNEGAPAGLYYHDYLALDKILNAQFPETKKKGKEAHEEHLFIIVHQVYELWFKQILFEVDSVLEIFSANFVTHSQLAVAVSRLTRVVEIQKILVSQISVLETMTPLQFLEFRDALFPASGFQSKQFRSLELKLGLEQSRRLTYSGATYDAFLANRHRTELHAMEAQPSLFTLVEKYLERTPGASENSSSYDFWTAYRQAVLKMCNADKEVIDTRNDVSDQDRAQMIAAVDARVDLFESLFDPAKYKERQEKGMCRLSHNAVKGALLITMNQHEPLMHFPFQLLTKIQEVDDAMTLWRYRHAQLVHRMLGDKVGTGGSSGYRYLQASATRHKVFADLFNLSTFLIPLHALPPLPADLRDLFALKYEQGQK